MANANKDKSSRWYFTKEQLESTPSRRCGFDAYKELQYRQQAANFIQDMGQKLQVSQLCISTAIVYMHRFYVFHSFTDFPWHQMAAAALFLAAKVEEQPRKLEYVIRVANHCKNTRERNIDVNSERYIAQSQDLVFNENVLLQTLGFDVAIDHPHTHVVKCCQLVRATKDLAQTSYFMASNSLHLTTMCIQYRPTVVACFCILLACKWSNWEIPLSNEKKEWYTYVDPTVTAELLEQLTSEFLVIFENCPSRLKEKITGKQENSSEQDKKSEGGSHRISDLKGDDAHKHRMGRPIEGGSSGGHRTHEQRERERKEKERIAHMSGLVEPNQHHHHHHRLSDPSKMKTHTRQNTGTTGSQHSSSSTTSSTLSSGLSTSSRNDVQFNRDHVQKEMSRKPDPSATNSNNNSGFPDMRQRIDPNRTRTEQAPPGMRRLDEQKAAYYKHDAEKKQHFGSAAHVKSSSAFAASTSTTSQKKKSPFNMLDNNKSVPRPPNVVNQLPIRQEQFNGSTNGSYSNRPHEPSLPDIIKGKTEPPAQAVKGEIPTPPVIKRPSLFSPEQTPVIKQEPIVKLEPFTALTALSPISSPPSANNRNYLNSSEPELKPAIKKIEQVEGFENVIRNNTINMANMRNSNCTASSSMVSMNQQPQTQDLKPVVVKQETASSQVDVTTIQPSIVNGGLETSPIVISNLLKEAVNLPGVVPTTSIKQETATTEPVPATVATSPSESSREHKHHKNKKKKEKHKHKDKEKSKDEKEKRKKHKDKSKEKHKHKEKKDEAEIEPPAGKRIMLTINKEKLQQCNEFKIKNKKTEANVDPLPLAQPGSGGLKIKIPKEFLNNCNASSSSSSKNSMDAPVSSHSSRKRERDRSPYTTDLSSKIYKSSHKESKQNGRHSHSKVAQGDGETSLRLAESKYTKGSS